MVSSDDISLIVAGVSLAGTLIIAVFSAWKQQSLETLKHNRELDKEVKKYSGPLRVAAWELQERLYDIVQTEIPAAHAEDAAGHEDLAIYSSFLLSQYLAWAFILREKTQFSSGTAKWHKLRMAMYKIDDELDRKVNREKGTYGHWPASRLWISEKAIIKDERAMRWDEFESAWKKTFEAPLAWYTKQIVKDTIIAKAKGTKVFDERLRRLQHLLTDLVTILDPEKVLQDDRMTKTLTCDKARWCDCESCGPPGEIGDENRTRRQRHDNFYGAPKLAKPPITRIWTEDVEKTAGA